MQYSAPASKRNIALFRNAFEYDDEPDYWKEATAEFPNHVPRFKSKEEAIEFTKKYCEIGSNPDEPGLLHSISTFTTWSQIDQYILPILKKYEKYDNKTKSSAISNKYSESLPSPSSSPSPETSNNLDLPDNGSPVYNYLLSRLNLPLHKTLNYQSTMNTLRYLFYHMKCGVLVSIRNGQIVLFCPFVNKHYTNNWNGKPDIDFENNNLEQYYNRKESNENYLPDKSQWWANGNIICNVHDSGDQWWGDHFLFQMKDLVAETCRLRIVPDCDFFINKRDYPQLKYNPLLGPVEPYGFIFDRDDKDPSQDIELSRHCYTTYAPILSFYSSDRFADIPMPPSEDWEAATGQVFPASFIHQLEADGQPVVHPPRDLFTSANLQKFSCSWDDKLPTAFFRGTATGGGTTAETNQRLHLAQLSHDWGSDENLIMNGYLDAQITGWNMRDKKTASSKMTYVRKKDFPFVGGAVNFVPIYRQSEYKYLVYAEGHCAACRYGFMMLLGSVILKVESRCVADQMWYFPLLKPYVDHVPVRADLSDLKEKIDWCRSHDDECRIIANRAKLLYDRFVSRDAVLDYMQTVFIEISKRYVHPPEYASKAPLSLPVPRKRAFSTGGCTQSGELCDVCRRRLKTLAESQQKAITEEIDSQASKKAARKARRDKELEEAKNKRQKR